MKIQSLQISNVLSFKFFADISTAEKIISDDGLNIIIGENGSGKSTALEVINFLFKRVLFKQYNVNQDYYDRRDAITEAQKKQILLPANNNYYHGFRLDPNWNSEDLDQVIRLVIEFDDIDRSNLDNLTADSSKLFKSIGDYTTRSVLGLSGSTDTYTLDIKLNNAKQTFDIAFQNSSHDAGFEYLADYNFFKESIAIYNLEHPGTQIDPLHESFTLISSYRNYHAFEKSITPKDHHPSAQRQTIRNADFGKSMNTSDTSEPPIFGIVRLRVAEAHFDLVGTGLTEAECEREANLLPFMLDINNRLRVVNLQVRVKMIDKRTWQYSCHFHDIRRDKTLTDINSLSAGQKVIIHLVFEAYGRGSLKGGVVIIDEPEIHLHYQFQNEYLQVMRELNKEQSCQYILVTHSEALINSTTINQVRRFSLTKDGSTEVRAPRLTTSQRHLIQILDNTRTTYAFFAKKVLLVEGETDRYFFKAAIRELYPRLDQEIAVLDIGGKGNFREWSNLFSSFGLIVYRVTDFDSVIDMFYTSEEDTKLTAPGATAVFKTKFGDWEGRIDGEYVNRVYILKNGDLEHYLKVRSKGLDATIDFCSNTLSGYLANKTDAEATEIVSIIDYAAA